MRPTTDPDDEEFYEEAIEPSRDGDDDPELTSLHQLSSIHSLVIYHHVVLDRILRACLLAPSAGHEVTYKLLMTLFGLILDLGKAVKEIQRGVLSTEEGEEIVRQLGEEWREKEAVFVSLSGLLTESAERIRCMPLNDSPFGPIRADLRKS